MTTRAKLSILVAAGAILLATPTMAASVLTEAFVANVRPNVDFLDRSSRLALDNSKSARIRRYAHAEAIEATIAANSLVAWTQANTLPGAAVALGEPILTPVAPVARVAAAPVDAVGATADIATGRSVAIDRPLTVTRLPREALLPAGADNLNRLSGMTGARFDALYRNTQRDSLHQLSTLYADYILNGDDPGLRAMATRELPKINRKLAELRRL